MFETYCKNITEISLLVPLQIVGRIGGTDGKLELQARCMKKDN